MTNLETLIEMLNSNDEQMSASAEALLGVCKYPEDYWIMPDYYYPGLRVNVTKSPTFDNQSERSKMFFHITSNDYILLNQLFSHKEERKYRKIKPQEDLDDVYDINLREDEVISLTNEKGETVNVPWSVLCGIFLKARELGYSRPDVLDNAGPVDKKLKEKWLANQEKIKELQSKID